MMELLSKQDSMTSAIEEVKQDLKKTRSHVDQLMEAQQNKVIDTDKNHKRKYPSSLTVMIHGCWWMSIQWVFSCRRDFQNCIEWKPVQSGKGVFVLKIITYIIALLLCFCSVNDTHNAGVKAFLQSEILASNKDEYSDSQISCMLNWIPALLY